VKIGRAVILYGGYNGVNEGHANLQESSSRLYRQAFPGT
jgi:hypothetical protein